MTNPEVQRRTFAYVSKLRLKLHKFCQPNRQSERKFRPYSHILYFSKVCKPRGRVNFPMKLALYEKFRLVHPSVCEMNYFFTNLSHAEDGSNWLSWIIQLQLSWKKSVLKISFQQLRPQSNKEARQERKSKWEISTQGRERKFEEMLLNSFLYIGFLQGFNLKYILILLERYIR